MKGTDLDLAALRTEDEDATLEAGANAKALKIKERAINNRNMVMIVREK
jgi:hypothetical protein